MPAPETTVEVGGRDVRVTSPDRVIYPATDATPEATKLDIARYYAAVGEAMIRALRNRPTTLERWPKGVHDGIVLATRSNPKADAFYQKRFPKGAPDFVETATVTFPSGRTADEVIVMTRHHVVQEFLHLDWTHKARRKLGVPVLHLVEHEPLDADAGTGEGVTGM